MRNNKSIFYVIGSTDIGGAETHLLRICKGLIKKGWDISIFSLANPGPLAIKFEETGARVIHPPQFPIPTVIRKPVRLLQIILLSLRLFLELLFKRPSIAHFFLPAAYLVGGPLSVLAGCKNRLMSRRSRNHYQMKHPKLASIEHFLHTEMHGILGNSKAVVQDLYDENVPEDKIGILYNGIEVDHYGQEKHTSNIRDSLGILKSSLVMVLVANLIPYKGHLDLLTALKLIKHELPKDWAVLFVGHGTDYRDTLKAYVDEHGLTDHIHFLGQRQDVPDLLAYSDIGLLTSHEEGFSNAVLEAMASGLPMVVTDVGGNAEVVEDGKCGYVVPAHNPEALAQAILKLSMDSELCLEMGENSKSIVTAHFTLEACINQYDALYENLLEGKSLKEWSDQNTA